MTPTDSLRPRSRAAGSAYLDGKYPLTSREKRLLTGYRGLAGLAKDLLQQYEPSNLYLLEDDYALIKEFEELG